MYADTFFIFIKLFLLIIWNVKFQIFIKSRLILLRVIIFVDYEDFEKILRRLLNLLFSRLKYRHCSKASTNAYINTIFQITQQETKQMLKGIAKTCGIQTDL